MRFRALRRALLGIGVWQQGHGRTTRLYAALMTEPIYLEHKATTLRDPEVPSELVERLREHWGSPSSGHACDLRAAAADRRPTSTQTGAHRGWLRFR